MYGIIIIIIIIITTAITVRHHLLPANLQRLSQHCWVMRVVATVIHSLIVVHFLNGRMCRETDNINCVDRLRGKEDTLNLTNFEEGCTVRVQYEFMAEGVRQYFHENKNTQGDDE